MVKVGVGQERQNIKGKEEASNGRQWEDEQKSRKRKVDEYSHTPAYILHGWFLCCWMSVRFEGSVKKNVFLMFAMVITYGREVGGSIRFEEKMVGIESLGRWVV